MVDQYTTYLAGRVLNEGKPITYRLLSRELRVHVNVAKQMLFDFYKKQNAKRSGSVNASYWVTGKKRPQPSSQHTKGTISQDDEDSFMPSSPFPSSIPDRGEEKVEDTGPSESHMIVREEELKETLASLEELIAIHVYSLQPGPLENMNILSTCGHEIRQRFGQEDSLETWKVYGTIHNPYIKRRTQRVQPVASAVPAPIAKAISKPSNTARNGSDSEDSKAGKAASQSKPALSTAKKAAPKLQRSGSDFFKSSFANAKPKAKKAEVEKPKEPMPVEDAVMMDASEEENVEDFPTEAAESEEATAKRKAERASRAEKLKHIFDDEDDSQPEDVAMDDAPEPEEEPTDDAPIDKEEAAKPAEPEPPPTISGGRRRAKRKVMKKMKVEDEEGYLVTKEEMVWESYSEDEPQPKKQKTPALPSTAKGKKGAKAGGRDIMSFFKAPPKK